jgi:hypothetical protein
MAEMISFRYAGFYDVPRFILLRHRGQAIYLQSPFDDNLDEYPDVYSAYQVPNEIAESVLGGGDWTPLTNATLQLIGEIPISTVMFDPTKRRTLDAACLDGLLNHS